MSWEFFGSILTYVWKIHSRLIFLKTSSKLHFRAYPDIQKLLGGRFKSYHEDRLKLYCEDHFNFSHLNSRFDWLEFVEKLKAEDICSENAEFH